MKHTLKKTFVVFLAILFSLSVFTSCASKSKTLMTLEKDGIKAELSLNIYELMLSRMKGSLVASNVTAGSYYASDDKFWDYLLNDPSKTLNDVYKEAVLENCKTYTAVLWLFEQRGLSLTEDEIAEADERMQELVTELAGGSKTKLNSLLSSYGVNYKMLREAYLLELKVSALETDLYGSNGELIGTSIKDNYLAEHYVRLKQVFLPTYTYDYETDKFGDEIYYNSEYSTPTVAYDTANGVTHIVGGIIETDTNGDDIYYTNLNYNHIAYDKINGKRSAKVDSTGTAITIDLSETELQALENQAQSLLSTLQSATPEEFESAITENIALSNADTTYTQDWYLDADYDYGSDYAYLTEMTTKLKSMEVGEVAMVKSDKGYHIIMKYATESGAYDDESLKEVWLSNFYSGIIESLFLDYCHTYCAEVVVNETVYNASKSMKEIEANLYY